MGEGSFKECVVVVCSILLTVGKVVPGNWISDTDATCAFEGRMSDTEVSQYNLQYWWLGKDVVVLLCGQSVI